jgi:ParB/RepB/Spo0J family partition protein
MSTIAVGSHHVPLDLIDVTENVRELDQAHVDALAGSIALRGLINPLTVRPEGERFSLIAGAHRYAACRKLGLEEIEVTIREQERSSADSAAENVVRKQLSPLEEARAVAHMLDEGYTLDGAASVLGWSSKLVSTRAKILDLPQLAQQLLGSGALPVSAVGTLTKIAEVSPELCDAVLAPVAEQQISGVQFANDPARTIGYALRIGNGKVFAAYLSTVTPHEIAELRLGKKTEAAYAQAEKLHKQNNRYAYGPPTVRFEETDIDQARAAGVLIELEHGTPIITDHALYRELAKQAINRTLAEQQATKQADDTDRNNRQGHGKQERSPQAKLESEHRATLRSLKDRAHGTNLDLGAALLQKLAVVDPGDIDVARFFAYGLLGPDTRGYLGKDDHTVATIAANGIRLVIEEHRTVTTPVLKSGKRGKTKVAYGEVENAATWLWSFVEGAKSAGELYGRVLVVFASQHYAQNLVLPASQRRGSVLPGTRKDTARKAFERITKNVLPASHMQLQRALEREARAYTKQQEQLDVASRKHAAAAAEDPDACDPEQSTEDEIGDQS